jgi:hypothetical protein
MRVAVFIPAIDTAQVTLSDELDENTRFQDLLVSLCSLYKLTISDLTLRQLVYSL